MINYRIVLEDGYEVKGRRDGLCGEVRIVESLPVGKLASVTAELPLSLSGGEKIFMNGFQTWTYCPELGRNDRIRSLRHLPKPIVRHYGLDRYGDEYFVDYPQKKGVSHGESWCYFRLGGHFRLIASLDERPGYTMLRYDANRGMLYIRRDCEGVRCGGEFHAFDLYFAEGGEDEVFDGWFAAMGVKPRTSEKLTGYSSWYNRYQNISEKSIMDDLAGCAEVLSPGDLFQIDDGWERAIGDWDADTKKFPHGMKAAVDAIHEKGFKAGLWLAPFVCQRSSDIMREHPEWLLRHDGDEWYCGCNWGGFFSLDIDEPECMNYLERCFRRVFDEWGFDLVKLDFLYGAAPFGTERESRAGRMIRAMEFLRRVCGDKLILGCGVPVMPAFGLVDYCRISCDVGLDWDDTWLMRQIHRERVSTRQAIGNSIFRRELNGRAYLSDPDVFFLRDENIKLTPEQKRTLAVVNALFGGLFLTSDNMGLYGAEAREFYKELLRIRNAENVTVNADDGLSVGYELDGRQYSVKIE